MFHLLPLLKGWEYKVHILEKAVNRGATPEELALSETGWLMSVVLASDDCYGTVKIDWQGADLQTTSWMWNAEIGRLIGTIVQDPGGWVQRYFRPNPNSTLGIYVTVVFSGGFQGALFPYIPTVRLKISLTTDSTEVSATVKVVATVIAITDKKAFIKSLRRLLDANASLKIDPALLAVGPADLKETEK
jgi:hypothetical protein